MKKLLLLLPITLLFLLFFYSKEEKLNYSFYHWKNSYKEKNSKEKLYIKLLDIKYSNKIEIVKTKLITQTPKDFIPVVYITNEAMRNTDFKLLAKLIIKSLNTYKLSFSELQIDCDWSQSSKSNYFNLLKNLKQKLKNKTLSATIRLHQIKYHNKTGTPPVDYGVLMYYNMSNIADFDTKNSILDNKIAKKYHYNFDSYTLKLKLALPLYSQAIQFRNKKALDIFEGVRLNDFDKKYFVKISKNKYKVIKSTYFKNRYIYKEDIFRFEDSNLKDIKTALNDFLKISKNHFSEIILYTLKYKNKYDLKKLLRK